MSTTGHIRVWDRRSDNKPVLTKQQAHLGAISSVAWSPFEQWVLATASKDKTMKIWQCQGSFNSEESSMSASGTRAVSAKSSSILQSRESTVEAVLLSTLHPSSEVARLSWVSDEVHRAKLPRRGSAVKGLLTTVSANEGDINVWDMEHPNVPYLTMKGAPKPNSIGLIDFQWLDSFSDYPPAPTPALLKSGRQTPTSDSATDPTWKKAEQNAAKPSAAQKSHLQKGSPVVGGSQPFTSLSSPPSAGSGSGAGAGTGNPSPPSFAVSKTAFKHSFVKDGPADVSSRLSSFPKQRYLLSLSQDGKVALHDSTAVFCPMHHMSSTVTAISSQGHLAYHRGRQHLLSCADSSSSADQVRAYHCCSFP